MSEPTKRALPPWVVPLGLTTFSVLVLATAFVLPNLLVKRGEGLSPAPPLDPSLKSALAKGPERELVELEPPKPMTPVFWLDVLDPAGVQKALLENAWLSKVANEPLGRGFSGPWAAFLGTRGQDVQATFRGAVLELFAKQLLDQPYRVIWFTGHSPSGVPALVVPKASATGRAAFEALAQVAQSGGFTPKGCPLHEGEEPKELELPTLQRLVLANQVLYGAQQGDVLVFGQKPGAVLQALCMTHAPFSAQEGVAVELAFDAAESGRGEQALAQLLGLSAQPRLAFVLEGGALAPRGIVATLEKKERLSSAPLSDQLLRLVPEATAVTLAVNVQLPERLSPETLKAHLSGKAQGALAPRQVAVLWNPRGNEALPTEVAVAWSRLEDEPALDAALTGNNKLHKKRLCDHLVWASTAELLAALERSCNGKGPSLLQAPAQVVAALREPTSVGVHVQLGKALSQLLHDGWQSESRPRPGQAASPNPPDIDAARRELEELPFMGWKAVVNAQGALVPGGFRS